HARAFLALAEAVQPDLFGPRQKERLDRLEQEQGNLRVALDICSHRQCADQTACDCGPADHDADAARVEVALRLVAALWRFWQMRGHLQEGRQRSERVLALPGAESHADAYLRALEAAAGVTYWLGDMEATERSYEKRLELARRTGDPIAIANALYDLSFAYILPDREGEAGAAMLEEALASYRAAGDRAGVAKALWALSTAYSNRADWVKAAEILDEVVGTFRELENRFGLAWALHGLGVARIRLGALSQARAALAEGLELFRDAGDVSGIVLFFYDFAELAATQGLDDRALRLFGAGRELKDRTGTQLADYLREENKPFTLEVRALLERTDADRREALGAEGAALSGEQAIAFALSDADAPEEP
ncbi:MAG: hypothetical protein ACRDGT_11405, partial [Candidatus Limnocylindria bacterium]